MKVEKSNIDKSWVKPKTCLKPQYSSEYSNLYVRLLVKNLNNVQRSSPDGRVEPQANGGRKILIQYIYIIGMTHDLRSFCNGRVWN